MNERSSRDAGRRSRLAPLSESLGGALRAAGDAPEALAAVARAWPRAVGELVAREAWPVRLQRDGTLVVHCRSSVWASELSLLAGSVRESLVREGVAPAPPLRFAVGTVPRRASEHAAPDPPPLSAPDRRQLEALVADLPEGPLRSAAARAIETSLRVRAMAGNSPDDTLSARSARPS
jgi:hypothetical protein